ATRKARGSRMKRPLEPSVEARGRVVGITDGVFAIALTLIVLEIRVPTHELIARSDRRLATLNLCFLAFIALLPFSTDMLADFLEFRTAVIVYWLNLLMLGVTLFASWHYAVKSGFLAEGVDAETTRTVYQR